MTNRVNDTHNLLNDLKERVGNLEQRDTGDVYSAPEVSEVPNLTGNWRYKVSVLRRPNDSTKPEFSNIINTTPTPVKITQQDKFLIMEILPDATRPTVGYLLGSLTYVADHWEAIFSDYDDNGVFTLTQSTQNVWSGAYTESGFNGTSQQFQTAGIATIEKEDADIALEELQAPNLSGNWTYEVSVLRRPNDATKPEFSNIINTTPTAVTITQQDKFLIMEILPDSTRPTVGYLLGSLTYVADHWEAIFSDYDDNGVFTLSESTQNVWSGAYTESGFNGTSQQFQTAGIATIKKGSSMVPNLAGNWTYEVSVLRRPDDETKPEFSNIINTTPTPVKITQQDKFLIMEILPDATRPTVGYLLGSLTYVADHWEAIFSDYDDNGVFTLTNSKQNVWSGAYTESGFNGTSQQFQTAGIATIKKM